MGKEKLILVTGATDGIGFQTALELAEAGHKVLVHGRNRQKSEEAVQKMSAAVSGEKLIPVWADLTDFEEIVRLAEEIKNNFPYLDVLINNAGVFENSRIILPNGFERTFMVNHLAVFGLTLLLLGKLLKTPRSRIVTVSSMAQAGTIDFDNLNGEKYFDSYNAYAVSKLENVLFTYKLSDILKGTGTTANCLHPGVVSTKLLHAGWGMGGVSWHEGARNSVYAALSSEMEGKSGLYLVSQKPAKSAAISYDKKIQQRLWDISLNIWKEATGLDLQPE